MPCGLASRAAPERAAGGCCRDWGWRWRSVCRRCHSSACMLTMLLPLRTISARANHLSPACAQPRASTYRLTGARNLSRIGQHAHHVVKHAALRSTVQQAARVGHFALHLIFNTGTVFGHRPQSAAESQAERRQSGIQRLILRCSRQFQHPAQTPNTSRKLV